MLFRTCLGKYQKLLEVHQNINEGSNNKHFAKFLKELIFMVVLHKILKKFTFLYKLN